MDKPLSTKEHSETHSDKINTYRKLSDDNIQTINDVKQMEQDVADFADRLMSAGANPRHVSIAKTHLETGYMYLIKAVAKPYGGLSGNE